MDRTKKLRFAGMLLALVAGCQTDKSSMTDFFPQEEEHSVRNICNTQAASGARADATLQPFHFDGEKLNSLGEAKLDLMLRDDDAAQPLVVYMNLSEKDASYNLRRDAVARYLEDRGATSEQIQFVVGPNPHARSLAAQHLARVNRTENSSMSGGEGSTVSADVAPAAPGGAMGK